MTMVTNYSWILACIGLILQTEYVRCTVIPVFTKPNGRTFIADDEDGGYYRSILIDDSKQTAFIGARNSIYKISLSDSSTEKTTPNSNLQNSPNFGKEETQVDTDWDPNSDTYKRMHDYLTKHYANNLPATESLSQVYKLKNQTYIEQCKRQLTILKLYYGDHLQLPIDDPEFVCANHNRGLTWLNADQGQLFSLRNGIFGTMPVGLTGVTDYDRGYPRWYQQALSLTVHNASDYRVLWYRDSLSMWWDVVRNQNRTCYDCGYSQKDNECVYAGVLGGILCFREIPIPNYMSTNYICDPTPNPTRIVVDTSNMVTSKADPIPATTRDSCPGTNLASTFMSGYHPDMATKTLTSQSGNGANNGAAIYILSEIGQEKQLDVNHEAFLGYEEPIPITGSASLALVRVNIQANGDVNNDDIVVSNPFKETWVTSPLTKYGRLVKTGNQATVPHRPRAVTLFEDDRYIYFFFREVGFETMNLPEFTINRYHYLWKSYDRAMSYPWEAERPENQRYLNQFERADSMFAWTYSTRDNYLNRTKTFNEHVYAPRLDAFKQGWDSAKMVSRVGRVCKSDTGLPMGTQDASIFNLDNQLSLSAFQTFLKSRLTCSVKVKAVPRFWRLRRDRYSLLRDHWLGKKGCSTYKCYMSLGSCAYSGITPDATFINQNSGVFCPENRQGRDVSFRAFYDYYSGYEDAFNPDGLFQYTLSGFSQTHWSYDRSIPSYTSVTYEYTELNDLYKVGDMIYGLFSSPQSSEGMESADSERPAASAVCQFTMDDIRQAFDGPFIKRMNNAWRPYDPRVEGSTVSPSPYSCDADPVESEAREVTEMDIEFTDESLPLEKELNNFDMRNKSSRLNFFEKDVEGSRTMWKPVTAEPIVVSKEVQYVKIQAELLSSTLSDITLLYLVTASGEIHKTATWRNSNQNNNCWKGNGTELEKWWREQTNLHNSSWGVDYFTLTQENETKGGNDYVFTSDWDCSSIVNEYNTLAIFRPFSDSKTKIWDIKLAGGNLVIGTDKEVKTVETAQCGNYLHCSTCARDPHCGWDSDARLCKPYQPGFTQNVKSTPICSTCLETNVEYDIGASILLHTTLGQEDTKNIDNFNWYRNGERVEETFGRFVLTRNSSLYIIGARTEDEATWELRDDSSVSGVGGASSGICMVTYNLKMSECESDVEKCLYDKKLADWHTQHESWQEQMYDWHNNMRLSGCEVQHTDDAGIEPTPADNTPAEV